MKLSSAPKQVQLKLLAIHSGELEIKLLELGMLRGGIFKIQRQAPLNGPMVLVSNTSRFILRKEDADLITVDVIGHE